MHHLVWFRTDLRIGDNPALYNACNNTCHNTFGKADKVTAIYIDCPGQWQQHGMSAIQRDFLSRNLQSLSDQLAKIGIVFKVLELDNFDDVPGMLEKWVAEHTIDAVYANKETGVNEQRRDHNVINKLSIPLHLFNGDCVVEAGKLKTGSGAMYRVFTPFSRSWLNALRESGYQLRPAPVVKTKAKANTNKLNNKIVHLSGERIDSSHWPAGEAAALQRLQIFCTEGLDAYGHQRDFPERQGTSGLSPYLALGVLSPNQCLGVIENTLGFLPLSRGETGFVWLNEIIWREFYRHLMLAYPRLSKDRAFKPETEKLKWNDNETLFKLWCDGTTGFPIVDAAMRCLNQTGWMHNRLRMIVASFLTKDCHIHWRRGEDYFMSRLIDGDLASNNGGWQWAAGTGADAAPYFRVFNPTTQGKRFDAEGNFIKRWLPELSEVPTNKIHTPHDWLLEHDPGNTYPPPVVDHVVARRQAIAMFEGLEKSA